MAEEHDLNFGNLAVQQGYCSQAQLNDALIVLREVRKLGLDERLGNVLVKKKFMTKEQVKTVLKMQGRNGKVQIAGYEIIEKIGKGGMGAVFKARQTSLDRVVAVKILNPRLAADGDFAERFMREAQAVAKLNHPNIILGIDVGRFGKYCYCAMEYVDGPTALDILQKNGPLSENRALQMGLQVARALEHAHRNGLVHRDVKPDNIMIAAQDVAKLCDLGLAKRIDLKDTDAGLTQVGSAVGTPHYISPEQARGDPDVKITADIYGLGATLYHLTTGKTLFKGDDAMAIMTQHLIEVAPNVQALNSRLGEPFCQLLHKMLAKDPKERQQSPTALIEDMELVLAGTSIKDPLPAHAKSSMAPLSRPQSHLAPRLPRAGITPKRATKSIRIQSEGKGPAGKVRPVKHSDPVVYGAALAGVLLVVVLFGLFLTFEEKPGVQSGVANNGAPESDRRDAGKRPESELPKAPGVAKEKKEPEKLGADSLPAELPAWPPLEQARTFRNEQPESYLEQLKRYDAAIFGAPSPVLPTIRQERDQVEATLNAVFEKALGERWSEAQMRMETRAFEQAFACVADAHFPPQTLTTANLKVLEEHRSRISAAVEDAFKKTERPRIESAFKSASLDEARLELVKGRLGEIPARFPAQAVGAWLKEMEARVDTATLESRRRTEQAFVTLIDEVRVQAEKGETEAALKQLVASRQNKMFMRHYAATLRVFDEDLQQVIQVLEKAAEALGAKKGSSEIVTLHASGIEHTGKVLQSIQSKSEGPSVELETSNGSKVLFLSKVDTDSLIKWAYEGASTKDHYAKAIHFFWRNGLRRAYVPLAQLKEDTNLGPHARCYVDWMERRAAMLRDRVVALCEQSLNKPHPGKEDEDKAKAEVLRLLGILKRDFGDTEVYRERSTEKRQ